VDVNGTAGGATWADVCIVDNGTSGADLLTMLIDGNEHNLIV
jgi:hypothetical protein